MRGIVFAAVAMLVVFSGAQAVASAIAHREFEESGCLYDHPNGPWFSNPVLLTKTSLGGALGKLLGRDADNLCPRALTVVGTIEMGPRNPASLLGSTIIEVRDNLGNTWWGVARPLLIPTGRSAIWGKVLVGDVILFDRYFYPVNW